LVSFRGDEKNMRFIVLKKVGDRVKQPAILFSIHVRFGLSVKLTPSGDNQGANKIKEEENSILDPQKIISNSLRIGNDHSGRIFYVCKGFI